MRLWLYTGLVILLLTNSGCNNQDHYAAKAKTLDSLSGAVNSMLSSIKKIDTALLERAVTRYLNYHQFISQNGTDTLVRSEANHLRNFVNSGKSLEAVRSNRTVLLERGSQVNAQLSALSDDVKRKAITRDQLNSLTQHEIIQANKLILQGYEQQKIFFSAMEEFKSSLPIVEQIIRRKNRGELPVVITNSVNL